MLRISVTRFITWARFGSTSLISRPGTDVAIGLNSPRTSAGAFGLGSNVSRCDGPPASQIRMQFFALTFAGVRPPGVGRLPGPRAEPEPVVQAQPEESQRAHPEHLATARAAAPPWLIVHRAGTWDGLRSG